MNDLLDPLKNPVFYAVPFFLLSIAIVLAALKWLDHDDNAVGTGTNRATGYYGKDTRTQFGAHVFDALTILQRTVPVALKTAKPGTPEFRFCEADPLSGKPYCAEHAAIAYVKPREKERREDAA